MITPTVDEIVLLALSPTDKAETVKRVMDAVRPYLNDDEIKSKRPDPLPIPREREILNESGQIIGYETVREMSRKEFEERYPTALNDMGVCLSGDSSLKRTAKSIPCESETPAIKQIADYIWRKIQPGESGVSRDMIAQLIREAMGDSPAIMGSGAVTPNSGLAPIPPIGRNEYG